MLAKFRVEQMDTAEIASKLFLSEHQVYNALIRARAMFDMRGIVDRKGV